MVRRFGRVSSWSRAVGFTSRRSFTSAVSAVRFSGVVFSFGSISSFIRGRSFTSVASAVRFSVVGLFLRSIGVFIAGRGFICVRSVGSDLFAGVYFVNIIGCTARRVFVKTAGVRVFCLARFRRFFRGIGFTSVWCVRSFLDIIFCFFCIRGCI